MKLMVIGHARHGKDSVCDLLTKHYGLTFESSSHFVAERAVKPWLAALGITYPDFDTMYADRVNHRAAWFDAIVAYNGGDPARLGRELYAEYDIYCGIRNVDELRALQDEGVIDCTLWVDASKRLPPEAGTSMTIPQDCADFVIDNNGSLEDLTANVHAAFAFAVNRAKEK